MNDLISRQAAIRWVKTECNPYGKPTLDFESGKKVIEHLKQMPSVQLSLESIVNPPILDDAEKRYLAGVIRPFRNKIKQITKYGGHYHNYYYEYIAVMYYVDQALTTYSFGLPVFPEGTMYKGMEVNRYYTLEELGLGL